MQQQTLSQEITIVRAKMYALASRYDYTHPKVVSCSQKLDRLLNEYQSTQKLLVS